MPNMQCRRLIVCILTILLGIFPAAFCAAAEQNGGDMSEEWFSVDYTDIDEELDAVFEKVVSFEELVSRLTSGEVSLDWEFVKQLLRTTLLEPFANAKDVFLQILLIAAISAVFTISVSVFGSDQASDVSFYVVFLLLVVLLARSFMEAGAILETAVTNVLEFCRVVMPTYMLVVAMAGGASTAVVFYEFFLFLAFAVEWLILHILLPMIYIYVVMGMINQLSKEDLFSKMADLIKTLISWSLKTILGLVIGFQIIQGLLTPFIDRFKSASIHKALQAIPGVGGAMGGATELVIGSGILIKNGIGTAALLFLSAICIVPLAMLALYAIVYQLSRALMQPIADERIGKCVECVQEGSWLLVRTMLVTGVLFFLTIAVLTASTNGGMS